MYIYIPDAASVFEIKYHTNKLEPSDIDSICLTNHQAKQEIRGIEVRDRALKPAAPPPPSLPPTDYVASRVPPNKHSVNFNCRLSRRLSIFHTVNVEF